MLGGKVWCGEALHYRVSEGKNLESVLYRVFAFRSPFFSRNPPFVRCIHANPSLPPSLPPSLHHSLSMQVKRRSNPAIEPVDFMPFMEELLAFHPGLAFLEHTPEFQVGEGGKEGSPSLRNEVCLHLSLSCRLTGVFILPSCCDIPALTHTPPLLLPALPCAPVSRSLACLQEKYARTVIARIFYVLDPSARRVLDARCLRSSNLLAAFHTVDVEEDITIVSRERGCIQVCICAFLSPLDIKSALR